MPACDGVGRRLELPICGLFVTLQPMYGATNDCAMFRRGRKYQKRSDKESVQKDGNDISM